MTIDVLPAGGRSREAMANAEINRTTISPAVARGLVLFFLAAIALVPMVELISGRNGAAGASVWSHLTQAPASVDAAVNAAAARGASAWQRVVAGNRALLAGLTGFETALEDESVLGHALRPSAQSILSGWAGAGNERVYVGRDGWLFFRPDVEYVTGRGFLEADVMQGRVTSATELAAVPQPDPRPAILAFHRQLAARGIALVIVPTPVKPGVHPERLIGDSAPAGVLQNASYPALIEELRKSGVLVFDPAPVLAEGRRTSAQYLATDTHWRPEAMEVAAERLAAFVNQNVQLPAAADQRFTIAEQEVTNAGDTVAMLDLPSGQRRYPPEKVVVSRVLAADGTPWRSDRAADVLVLGDSFSNIYSLGSMGWGESAGFVEHVSYALGRPVDRIVQNDAGAHATRELLPRSGPDRVAGKRVVIWQFAARELASGDWKVLD